MGKRLTLLLGFWAVANYAQAQTVYRCEVDGRSRFQQTPCAGAKATENIIDAKPRSSGLGGGYSADLARQSDYRTAAESGKVMLGMTPEQVRHAWGWPTKINSSSGGGEQWVYRWSSGNAQYVYFDNGVVSAWN